MPVSFTIRDQLHSYEKTSLYVNTLRYQSSSSSFYSIFLNLPVLASFPHIPLCHLMRSWASAALSLIFFMSDSTICLHINLGHPLGLVPTSIVTHFLTQLLSSLRSTCPSHLVDGKRSRRRPRLMWRQIVESDMKKMWLKTADAQDRHKWRSGIWKKPANPGRPGKIP